MTKAVKFYTDPEAMEPMFPEDNSGELETLSIELIEKSKQLSGTANALTRKAIADFLRPMNSYYSNLIEGHDTHPIDIERALNNDFSKNKAKRDKQKEAHAHIKIHETLSDSVRNKKINPSSTTFIKHLHKAFYDYLPDTFKTVISKEGKKKTVIPGEYRTSEVEVGKHIAPAYQKLPEFMERFEAFYSNSKNSRHSKIKRIITIAAAHHRLAWIHPFLDGNGRVVRLYSDACFIHEDIDATGLWSISRGLARSNTKYKDKLSNADAKRQGAYDGRGNLSNKALVEFCVYFIKTAIDQVEFMNEVLDTANMLERIEAFSDLMVLKKQFRPEAKYILTDLFLKGKISKKDAMRITNTSDKTLKITTDRLADKGLLQAKKEGLQVMYYVKYPVKFSPMLFPDLYPGAKETDMLLSIE